MFQKMKSQLQKLEKKLDTNNDNENNNVNSNNTDRTCHTGKTADNTLFTRNQTDKYCWTHGACAHSSDMCTAKADGRVTSLLLLRINKVA